MSKSKKKKKRRKREKKERREQFQAFQAEFNDTVDVVVDKLLTYTDDFDTPSATQSKDLPEGFIIEYEINNMKALAQMLRQKLPLKLQKVEGKPRIPEGNILLWHGTSLIRANSILESGFRSKKRGVFFSSNIMTSVGFSERRASAGRSEPAIFAAVYDLSTLKYGKEFQHQYHYIFRPGVATRIVKYLLTCHGLYAIGKIITDANRFKDDMTDIAITQSSGNTGIAYWINSFLDLDDSECISENHPAVGQIKAWVDEQYADDRMVPITDEEILILAKEYLPEYFQGI
ncbi:hypothetical protein H8E77_37185 [bacterium]|nr:hypothetical protein [bacterium]